MKSEPYSYIAYIDESGDDGLTNFRAPAIHGGASFWLVISACVYRFSSDWRSIEWRNEILKQMPDKRSKVLHFVHLNHGQKVAAAQYLSKQRIRAINIIANKPVIPDGVYKEKNQLYFYLTRYLIERLSWFCRDYRHLAYQKRPPGSAGVAVEV
jgi:hypothetical protein